MAKTKKSNLRPLLIIFGLVLLTLVLVIATNMVQKNQESRASASAGMDILRGVCKEIICGSNQSCRNSCDQMVFRFNCGMLTKVDNIRNGACFTECKLGTLAVSKIIGKSTDDICIPFCTTVVNMPGRVLGCTDDACLNLNGECSAPLSRPNGASCTMKNGKAGSVIVNKCLAKESATKRCCVPNITCDSKGGVCITSHGGMTSGIKCTSGGKTGKTNTGYTCSSDKVCCVF